MATKPGLTKAEQKRQRIEAAKAALARAAAPAQPPARPDRRGRGGGHHHPQARDEIALVYGTTEQQTNPPATYTFPAGD
jgi:hypothetical protein